MRHGTWQWVGMAVVGLWSGTRFLVPIGHPGHPSPSPQVSTAHLVDGATLYEGYCAPCHGQAGKGDGPLADYLRRPPVDLTTIALKHDGAFPAFWVEDFITGRGRSLPPGHDQMPNWGRILRSRSASEAVYRLKVRNLVDYLRGMQVK